MMSAHARMKKARQELTLFDTKHRYLNPICCVISFFIAISFMLSVYMYIRLLLIMTGNIRMCMITKIDIETRN